MNGLTELANKLADEVDIHVAMGGSTFFKEVSSMLRQFGLAESIIKQQQIEIEALKAAVRSFFNDYLDQREESDSGRVFAPIAISNCRCMTLDPMSKLMTKMRELSGAKPPPKREE